MYIAHGQKEFVKGLSKFLEHVHGLNVVDDSSTAIGAYARGLMLEETGRCPSRWVLNTPFECGELGCTSGMANILLSLAACRLHDVQYAVVIVLSPEFVRERHPMGELHMALETQKCPGGPQRQQLCPLFYSLSVDNCSRSDFREQYDLQPWDSLGLKEPKPEPEVLDSYAKDIKELCTLVGLPEAQVCTLFIDASITPCQ